MLPFVALSLSLALAPFPPPLGRLSNIVTPPPQGGTPSSELVVTVQLEGCDRPQAFWLSRFAEGAVMAASQLERWMASQAGLERKLFRRPQTLPRLVTRARSGLPSEQRVCAKLAEGWKLAAGQAPKEACPEQVPEAARAYVFALQGPAQAGQPLSALVQLSPQPEGSADRCLPRLSVALLEASGAVRFRYHADFGAAASAELVGERCLELLLRFDEARQLFLPTLVKNKAGCGKAGPS